MHSCLALHPALLGLLLLPLTAAELLRFDGEYNHNCSRKCNGTTQVCQYNFRLEWYQTMSQACHNCPLNLTHCLRPHCITGDGFKRALLSVNRQLSGPGIHVCKGDTVEVTVHNMMGMGEGTSIHWHGMYHSDGTQHMDGVSQVTQCEIDCHTKFTYRFTASPSGTHFWHSHSGLQRVDGIYGPLVVRLAADPHEHLYDFDWPQHTLVLADWAHELVASKFTGYHFSNGTNKAKDIVINGRGASVPYLYGTKVTYTPRYVLKLKLGYRYRIRVIGSGSFSCPMEVSVANHTLLAIASDGEPFEPVVVDSIIVNAGERFDFVLTANQSVGNYLLKVVGVNDCVAQQSAIVSYEGADEMALQGLNNQCNATYGRQLNPYNRNATDMDIMLTALKSLTSVDWQAPLRNDPFYLAFDFENVSDPRFHDPVYYPDSTNTGGPPMINNLAMEMPSSPLIHQMNELDQAAFCNNTEFNPNYVSTFTQCIHALRIRLNQVVEIVLIDKGASFNGSMSHPFHLHGQHFAVIGMEKLGDFTTVQQVKSLNNAGRLKRNLVDKPVLKDTVAVPGGGYAIVRFNASNPGPWFLHCHLEFHVDTGMALLLLVGDPADWASRVPANFPRCGNWKTPANIKKGAANEPSAGCRRETLGLGLGLGLGAVVLASRLTSA